MILFYKIYIFILYFLSNDLSNDRHIYSLYLYILYIYFHIQAILQAILFLLTSIQIKTENLPKKIIFLLMYENIYNLDLRLIFFCGFLLKYTEHLKYAASYFFPTIRTHCN